MPPKRTATTRPDAPISGELLRIIEAHGTPYAVAVAAGLAPSVLTRFVSGERGLSLESLDAVASALDLRLVRGARRGKARPRAAKVVNG